MQPHVGRASVPEGLESPGRSIDHSGGASWRGVRQESKYALQVRGRQFEDDEWVSSRLDGALQGGSEWVWLFRVQLLLRGGKVPLHRNECVHGDLELGKPFPWQPRPVGPTLDLTLLLAPYMGFGVLWSRLKYSNITCTLTSTRVQV